MTSSTDSSHDAVTRRSFVKTTAALGVGAAILPGTSVLGRSAHAGGDASIRIGVIGCGNRGSGAAANALEAHPGTKIVAMADLFGDRLNSSHRNLSELEVGGSRVEVSEDAKFVGFDAYQQLLDSVEVDYVVLATSPHFRPIHLEAAIKAGRNVFMEKPVAVDPTGIRKVIAAGEMAAKKNLSIVAGTQRRHEACYLEAMDRLGRGDIGDIVSAECYWNQGGLWVKDKQPEWTDMEWQCRNWLYFTWLSGDHICEQHIHNLDVVNWAMGGHPTKVVGLGGREVRTAAKYGNIFDHFSLSLEYEGGRNALSMCRQIDGCDSRVNEVIHGSKGRLYSTSNSCRIEGSNAWKFEDANPNPYVTEHADLIRSITSGGGLNEARRVAESTLTAIMGRMSCYTGKAITWDQAMNSKLDLSPAAYAFGSVQLGDGLNEPAIPGRTPLI